MRHLLISLLFITGNIFASDIQADPLSKVGNLLDNNGGISTGENKKDGYYIVSLALSENINDIQAKELARLEAFRQLSEYLNGITISGKSLSLENYESRSKGKVTEESSSSRMSNVVKSQFKGNVNSSRVIKEGRYKEQYFVAITITEQDSNNKSRLVTQQDLGKPLLTNSNNRMKTISAKGIASLKHGTKKARDEAIQDALRNAVQQANGIAIKSKAARFNSAIVMSVSNNSQGYIRTYEILSETFKRGECTVEIKAEIDEAKLVGDVKFFLDAFSFPTFNITSDNNQVTNWFIDELEELGFIISEKTNTTHSFNVTVNHNEIINHLGNSGIETNLVISLLDNTTKDLLFTIKNKVNKSKIYVTPTKRAKQISIKAAQKSMKKILPKQLFKALVAVAERGTIYEIALTNATRKDLDIFKLVFSSGTSGNVEKWQWNENNKSLKLFFRYSGPLSEAMDEGLDTLYMTYKQERPNKKPHAVNIDSNSAEFTILSI